MKFLSTGTSASTPSRPFVFDDVSKSNHSTVAQTNAQMDVMRLTAYVSELTSRMQKGQQRLKDTESQLHRTSQALASERQHAEAVAKTHNADMCTARETENKLRSELSNRPKRSALTESHFSMSVGSLLQEEQREHAATGKLLELETKVQAMGDAKVLIESELAALEDLKEKAQLGLDTTRKQCQEEKAAATAAANELAEKQTLATAEHTLLTKHVQEITLQETELVRAISSLAAHRIEAEENIAVAKTDLQRILVEHGTAAAALAATRKAVETAAAVHADAEQAKQGRQTEDDNKADANVASVPKVAKEGKHKVDAVNSELEAYQGRLCAAKEEMCELTKKIDETRALGTVSAFNLDTEANVSQNAPGTLARKRSVVHGASAPQSTLCCGSGMGTAAIASRASFGCARVPALVAIDASPAMTLLKTCISATTGSAPSDKTDPSAAMIDAVVSDLKAKLTEISTQTVVMREVAPLA